MTNNSHKSLWNWLVRNTQIFQLLILASVIIYFCISYNQLYVSADIASSTSIIIVRKNKFTVILCMYVYTYVHITCIKRLNKGWWYTCVCTFEVIIWQWQKPAKQSTFQPISFLNTVLQTYSSLHIRFFRQVKKTNNTTNLEACLFYNLFL